ncbi:MAG: hypothetical protein GY822_16430 [Deltaproteobacteria bacterium]|nr:hypothetical protein [Deltaproteobacteria bacterium]
MRLLKKPLAAASFGIFLLVGCASDEGAKKENTVTENSTDGEKKPQGATRIADDAFDPAAFEKRDLDLNGDGKADAYQFLTKGKPEDVLVVRKEIDVNFDGNIDIIRTMDEKGNLIQERFDHDFDGRIDVVNIFERGSLVRKEYDTNYDGTVDMWRFFDNAVIARKEADMNFDGKVDLWEYYEKGQIDRVGIDRNADGVVDDWQTAAGEG